MRGNARLVFTLLLVLTAMSIFATSDALPQTVASHFGANGRANGWMSRDGYVLFMLCFSLGVPLFMVLTIGWLPRVMPRLINLPNRDYWLSGERRDEALGYLLAHAYRLGSVTLLFMLGLHLLVLDANTVQPPRLAGGLLVLLMVLLFAALGLWTLALLRRFRRP
jgi:Domain of unknown function (DUF1648)